MAEYSFVFHANLAALHINDIVLVISVVFGILTLLTRWLTDRALVRAGLCLSLLALIWHTCTIPNFTIGKVIQTIVFLLVVSVV